MTSDEWRMTKGKRELPCCGKKIRVKIVEPGIQFRHCDRHDKTHYFELVPMQLTGTRALRFKWVSEKYAKKKLAEFNAYDPDEFTDLSVDDL